MKIGAPLIVLALGLQLVTIAGVHSETSLAHGVIRGAGEKNFLLCWGSECIRVFQAVPPSWEGRIALVEGTKKGNAFFVKNRDAIDIVN